MLNIVVFVCAHSLSHIQVIYKGIFQRKPPSMSCISFSGSVPSDQTSVSCSSYIVARHDSAFFLPGSPKVMIHWRLLSSKHKKFMTGPDTPPYFSGHLNGPSLNFSHYLVGDASYVSSQMSSQVGLPWTSSSRLPQAPSLSGL